MVYESEKLAQHKYGCFRVEQALDLNHKEKGILSRTANY